MKIKEGHREFLLEVMQHYTFIQNELTQYERDLIERIHATGRYTRSDTTCLNDIRRTWISEKHRWD
jgi:hypothetical protein